MEPKDTLLLLQPTSCAHIQLPVCLVQGSGAPVLVGAESQLLRIANVLWQQAGSLAAAAAVAVMSTAGDQLTKHCMAATNQQLKPAHKSSKVPFQRDAES